MHPHWSSILIKAFIGVYLLLDEIKSLLRSDTNANFHLFFHYRRHKIVPSFPVQYIFNLFQHERTRVLNRSATPCLGLEVFSF